MYSNDTFTAGAQRSRFTDGSLDTASGSRVIVMCFERLDRDLAGALQAIDADDHESTNSNLRHAQDLLSEMVAMLDVGAWEHAPTLLSVYDYLLRRLAFANIFKDPSAVAEAQRLVVELGEAFRGAADEVAAVPSANAATAAVLPANPAATSNAVAEPVLVGGSVFDPLPDRPRLSVRA